MKNFQPIVHTQELAERIMPQLRYDGSLSFTEWQKTAEAKLKALLGMDKFNQCEDCLEIEYDVERDKFREIRFNFQSEEGYFVPCHFLIPEGLKGPAPVVLCLQGHSTGMHISLGRAKFERDAR